MGKKVKELISNPLQKKADDASCSICHPNPKKISHDKLWAWSRKTKTFPLKDGVKV